MTDKLSSIQEGDVIGIVTDKVLKDRKIGISHVGIVVKKKGQLYLAESSQSYGVVIRPLKEGLSIFESESKKAKNTTEPIFIGRGLPK